MSEFIEKISDVIANHAKFAKPLLVYDEQSKNKIYRITKNIEKRFGNVSIYSCDDKLFISSVDNEKSPFVILDQFQKVWDNKKIVEWAASRKNLILIANDDNVPETLNEFFIIKKYVK